MAWIYCSCLFSSFRRGEAGRAGLAGLPGTVGAMDGAIEPPWMGSRRVPGSPANPAHALKPNEATL
ncbi:hypothetical protein DAIF1_18220 [Stenotrophomonas indicatrix]|nr:hypothetical protein DAIF1_18220 [Stenotrophomonas indicatrix]